ncbi:iron-sulfur assembly protein, putative [Plasmodium knowlesi strain H]|uniref:Iron-sulfur assembly protein, putative n=4 Tax=Plasmodium knowlesi TaxID=5850 RepID=A0A5K1V8W4_PLAKH|nr:iron-sulfur assembly protein, putative [Plasmodium knowlesi strain H]OTN66558.1 putative Iron-sulfur assembly protein [Plasmodium knowlesi]CAA9986779.1 iron-sulfur assembly protein, putative [Plasmodium knowlesi strain H]SBO23614.1 iron-sulfur assembly protein, putative [Plasmodium knowlesi strain H]SBO25179.1 iron-sulfur assembly protein, putative [Plasmodium knowlesi strain H]VVS76253.1 iron-sulfur assembly protein, putative [Plasmodium knowlesi strain H]|eukprot:XP_002257963.1 iron-sulfur assembly protein, putative [Plasmodium knowlesi strain H]
MFHLLKGKRAPNFRSALIKNMSNSSSPKEENTPQNTTKQIIDLSNDAINKMKQINLKYKNSKALKVSVEAGGCSGFQYSFSLIDKTNIQEKDLVAYNRECLVVIDKGAAEMLKNSKIDYTNNLIAKKFVLENIQNLSSKCSCGNSFDIKLF